MTNNNYPLFYPENFFMVRTPILSIETFFTKLTDEKFIESLISICKEDEFFRLAIAISSPSLFNSLHYSYIKDKKHKQVRAALLKYFLRMSSRPVPFGLFSFISIGTINDTTRMEIDLSKVHMKIRPDMEWLFSIVSQLYENDAIIPFLSVRNNPLVFQTEDLFFLERIQKINKKKKIQYQSIAASTLVKAIFKISKIQLSINEILNLLIKQYPLLKKEKILEVIRKLLKMQFLTSSLFPSLLTNSPFEDFLKNLSSLPLKKLHFKELSKRIKQFNSKFTASEINELSNRKNNPNNTVPFSKHIRYFEKSFFQIKKLMQKMSTSENYLQVDSCYSGKKILLSKDIANELSKATEILWRISNFASNKNPLSNYHKKFLEKYGKHRLISLTELLQEEGGLGIPNSDIDTFSLHSEKKSAWQEWLRNEWMECLRGKKTEIIIKENYLDQFDNNPNNEKAPSSFDLYFEVISQSESEINKGNYLLYISSLASTGGSTFGRFLYLLNEPEKDMIYSLLKKEEDLEQDKIFVESSFHPNITRNGNVAIHNNLRKHAIDLGGIGNISLEDVVVGATNKRLYFLHKDSNKELIITSGNLLNSNYAPMHIKFMRDVSRTRQYPIRLFPWESLESNTFLPRVRYNKTILSAARWRFKPFDFGFSKASNKENIKTQFLSWITNWNIPQYCYLGDADQQILVDLRQPSHLQEIITQAKQNKTITLRERINPLKKECVSSQQGSHRTEFVMPFIKNQFYKSHTESLEISHQNSIQNSMRWKLPGSDWLYTKYYLPIRQENEFLINQVSQFTNYFLEKGIIKKWYFIRYADPKTHIRIRFHGNPTHIVKELLPALHNWNKLLLSKKIFNEFNISSYEREIERYGGEQLIESAETLFYSDSITAMFLLKQQKEKNLKLSEEVIAALSIIDILGKYYPDLNHQLSFLSSFNLPRSSLEGYRKHKTDLLYYGKLIISKLHENNHNDGTILLNVFKKRESAYKTFLSKLDKTITTSTQESILDSIIHMHCNRLFRENHKKELKARLYAYQTLSTIIKSKLQLYK